MLVPLTLSWPIVVVVCVSVGLASVLVLYIVVRIRSGNRKHSSLSGHGDDIHPQMEWEDDIGLNIIVNPLDTTTKQPIQSINLHNNEQIIQEYENASSEEGEYEDQSQSEYSSEDDNDDDDDDDDENNHIHLRKGDHQLEWDDEEMEYGPKKV